MRLAHHAVWSMIVLIAAAPLASAAIVVDNAGFESPDKSGADTTINDWSSTPDQRTGVIDKSLNGVPDPPEGQQAAFLDDRATNTENLSPSTKTGVSLYQGVGVTSSTRDWILRMAFANRTSNGTPASYKFGLYEDTDDNQNPDTVLAESTDPVALDGSFTVASVTAQNVPSGTDLFIGAFAENNENGSADQMLIDNTAIIPEPASLALLAPAGLLMLRRRRR